MIGKELSKYLMGIDPAAFVFDEEGSAGNMFIDTMPNDPDEAIAVMTQPGLGTDVKLGYDEPGVQFIIRGPAYDPRPALATARRIYSELHGLHDRELPDGTWLVSCIAGQSDPNPIGSDQNNRYEYTLNFQCEVRALTANRE